MKFSLTQSSTCRAFALSNDLSTNYYIQPDAAPDEGLQGIAYDSAPLLLNGAYSLFAVYVTVIGFDLIPLRLLDPLWLISSASSLVNAVSLPLGGLIFTHIAAALAPKNVAIHQRRRMISRFAAWAALGFLMLIPVLGWATWRGATNIQQASQRQEYVINKNSARLLAAIQSASTTSELQQRMQQLQGPEISSQDLNIPLPQLKKLVRDLIANTRTNLLAQLPRPDAQGYLAIYRQALRNGVLSAISALAFAALIFDRSNRATLLQSWLKPRHKIPKLSSANNRPYNSLFQPPSRFLQNPLRSNRRRKQPTNLFRQLNNHLLNFKRNQEIRQQSENRRKIHLIRERQQRMQQRKAKRNKHNPPDLN